MKIDWNAVKTYVDSIKECYGFEKTIPIILPKYKTIELWVLADEFGRTYYTGHSEELAKNYQESNGFKDKQIVKLTGEIKNV